MSSPESSDSEEMGLHLSETSSSFDENDFLEEEDEEIVFEGDEDIGVLPYQFEPLAEELENAPDGRDAPLPINVPRAERLDDPNRNWCLCGECPVMPTEEECVCCQEIEEVNVTREENRACITQHEGFGPICSNVHVLQVAYYQYRQQYGERHGHEINDQYRYTAYRQFVRWCWGFLGRHVRVVLPACAVQQIRHSFPAAEFAGFRYPVLN